MQRSRWLPQLSCSRQRRLSRKTERLTEDPEIKCFMPGVPRATYMPYPFQIEQGSKVFMIAYEYESSVRTIRMDNPRA